MAARSTRGRRLFWILPLAVLLGLAGGLAILPSWIDWTRFRPDFIRLIGDLTGRRIAIDGDIRLSFAPTPSLKARDLRLGEAAGERSSLFVRIAELQADFDLAALFMGNLRLASLRLDRPIVEFLDLPGSDDFFGLDRGNLDRLTIRDGEIGSPLLDSEDRLNQIEAEVTFSQTGEPPRLTARFQHRMQPWRIDARLASNLVLTLGGGQRDGPVFRLTGEMTAAKEPRFTGKLKGDGARFTEVAQLIGVGVPKPAEERFALEADLEIVGETLSIRETRLTLGGQRVMGEIGVAWKDRLTWRAKLNAAHLDLDAFAQPWRPVRMPRTDSSLPEGRLTLTGDTILWRSGLLRKARLDLAWEEDRLTLSEGSVVLPGGTEVGVNGVLKPDAKGWFTAQATLQSEDLGATLAWAGIAAPDWLSYDGRFRRFSGSLSLSGDREHLSVEPLDLRFDASRVTGSLQMANRQGRPFVIADLAADQLPLVMGKASFGGNMQELARLQDFDASLSLILGQSRLADYPLQDVRMRLDLAGGVLTIAEARARGESDEALYTLDGTINLDQTPPLLDLKARGAWPDSHRLAELLGYSLPVRSNLEGRLTLGLSGPLSNADVKLGGKLGASDVRIDGTCFLLDGKARLEADLQHDSQAEFLRDWDVDWRSEKEGSVRLTAQLFLDADQITAETLTLRLPDFTADARGDLRFPYENQPWKLKGGIGIATLSPASWRKRSPDELRLTEVLTWPLEADIALRLGSLEYAPYSLTDLTGEIRLKEGAWRFEATGATLYEGQLVFNANLMLDANSPSLTLDLDLKDAALGRVSEAFLDGAEVEGRFGLTGGLTAHSQSFDALPGDLTGHLTARLEEGRLKEVDPDGLKSALAPEEAENPQRSRERGVALAKAFTSGQLAFHSGDVVITLAKGNATAVTQNMALKTPELSLTARGTLEDLRVLRQGQIGFALTNGDAVRLVAERRDEGWRRRLEWIDP